MCAGVLCYLVVLLVCKGSAFIPKSYLSHLDLIFQRQHALTPGYHGLSLTSAKAYDWQRNFTCVGGWKEVAQCDPVKRCLTLHSAVR